MKITRASDIRPRPIEVGDFIAVYAWDGGVAAFHNGGLAQEWGDQGRESFVTRWLDLAWQHGASFRFDVFVTRERAERENALDGARGALTATILDLVEGNVGLDLNYATKAFARATVAAYGGAR